MSEHLFQRGSSRARESGRKGGKATQAQARGIHPPYLGTILDVMDAAGLVGDTWLPWRVFWKAVFALPLSDTDLALYTLHTGRKDDPAAPFREVWLAIGRRGGKSRNAALGALYLAITFDPSTVAPGEVVTIPVICPDRKQARQVLGYLRGLLALPDFKGFLHRELKETVELRTKVNIEVHTASYRTVRGYTLRGAILDELAFWRTDETSSEPDLEVVASLRPGMATVPDSLLLGLSSPYAQRGALYEAHQSYYGQEDPEVLVWNASSLAMNPTLSPRVVARAFEKDPVSAASEYGQDGHVTFRTDVSSLLDPEVIRAATINGRHELPPAKGGKYAAFTDPSGGSADSFTLAIAHQEDAVTVVDLVRERRPPFSPDQVVEDYASVLASYGLKDVTGDAYAGEWVAERFRTHGIRYSRSEKNKSALYGELVPVLNTGAVELPDLPQLRAQLMGLERRVARGGKDSIDHAPGAHDDLANALAGAIWLCAGQGKGRVAPRIWFPGMVDTMSNPLIAGGASLGRIKL